MGIEDAAKGECPGDDARQAREEQDGPEDRRDPDRGAHSSLHNNGHFDSLCVGSEVGASV